MMRRPPSPSRNRIMILILLYKSARTILSDRQHVRWDETDAAGDAGRCCQQHWHCVSKKETNHPMPDARRDGTVTWDMCHDACLVSRVNVLLIICDLWFVILHTTYSILFVATADAAAALLIGPPAVSAVDAKANEPDPDPEYVMGAQAKSKCMPGKPKLIKPIVLKPKPKPISIKPIPIPMKPKVVKPTCRKAKAPIPSSTNWLTLFELLWWAWARGIFSLFCYGEGGVSCCPFVTSDQEPWAKSSNCIPRIADARIISFLSGHSASSIVIVRVTVTLGEWSEC